MISRFGFQTPTVGPRTNSPFQQTSSKTSSQAYSHYPQSSQSSRKQLDRLPHRLPRCRPRLSRSFPHRRVSHLPFVFHLQERTRKDPSAPKLNVPGITQEAAPRYNALSTYEKEQLLSRVAEEREQYPALLKAWMDTLTPEMIKDENLLRYRRRKAGLSNRKNLKLAGEPKSPLTPYMRCVTFPFFLLLRGFFSGGGDRDRLKAPD